MITHCRLLNWKVWDDIGPNWINIFHSKGYRFVPNIIFCCRIKWIVQKGKKVLASLWILWKRERTNQQKLIPVSHIILVFIESWRKLHNYICICIVELLQHTLIWVCFWFSLVPLSHKMHFTAFDLNGRCLRLTKDIQYVQHGKMIRVSHIKWESTKRTFKIINYMCPNMG